MSEKEAVTVEAAAEEKVTESKEAKGTKRAAEVSFISIRVHQATTGGPILGAFSHKQLLPLVCTLFRATRQHPMPIKMPY